MAVFHPFGRDGEGVPHRRVQLVGKGRFGLGAHDHGGSSRRARPLESDCWAGEAQYRRESASQQRRQLHLED
eukprot:scaffold1088_cov247-Pinguiococcus_pyrenoidosus.AAC.11